MQECSYTIFRMVQAVDKAYQAIHELIVQGQYPFGARLTEEELARRSGVSRTPVREALRLLAIEGLVELTPNKGAFVANWTARDLEEIFGLRALLESYGAGLAAKQATPEDLERLTDLADQMDALVDGGGPPSGWVDSLTKLNTEFHLGVLIATGNSRLVGLLSSLVKLPLVHRTFERYSRRALQRSMAQHRELLDALVQHDADWASSVMRSHILAARHVFPENGKPTR
jgi:DNA-binding GntR family transcriptional regulator